MTVVHYNFVGICTAALARTQREGATGRKRSFTMTTTGAASLDRAFDALQRRAK